MSKQMTNTVSKHVALFRKLQMIETTSVALAYQIQSDESRKAHSSHVIYDYSAKATTPKAVAVLGCNFAKYFSVVMPFILNNLDMKISNGHVIRCDNQSQVSHSELLKHVKSLMFKYQIIYFTPNADKHK